MPNAPKAIAMTNEFVVPEQFRPAIKEIVHELVMGNYNGLEADGRAGDLNAQQLKTALTEYYPCTLIELPDEAWEVAEAYYVERTREWAIDVDLWTVEEGHSDLTLQLMVRDTNEGILVAIEDLHVL